VSNVAALIAGRAADVGDGVYLERATPPEPVLEEHLRAWVARVPRLIPLRKRWLRFVEQANVREPETRALDDRALVASFRATCAEMRRQGFAEPLLAKAFAAVREASVRSLGMRHFDVQLVGGWTLLQGRIAEMETGEGKTLVATLPACVGAASGAAVHVVTVNDYLAKRDVEQNQPLYKFMGLSVGLIQQGMSPSDRREQYARDVVYVSNKELVFDYLKDRIAAGSILATHLRMRQLYRPGQQTGVLLRGLHLAIVDEADSVLIDEARTPLIISETKADTTGGELYHTAIGLAKRMSAAEHFELSARNDLWLKPAAEQAALEMTMGMAGVWTSPVWRRELFQKALTALHCFHRDRHYIVAEDKIQIVDEFTGRVMPDRSWEHGLHQMIEAKEGCEVTGERKTLERITYQRFFRRYLLLAGMTGTATEVAPELRRVYDLDVVRIPTNKPSRRQYLPASCWRTQDQRWKAVADRAESVSRAQRAVLIGTRSVEASERLSALLTERGVNHTVLNARQDSQEAATVSEAGQTGRITVATNMAGRGTDIRPSEEVLTHGGLHVILTEYHESKRIDRQLFGRCARQGQPGTVEAVVSLEDELFARFAPGLRALCLKTNSTRRTLPQQLLRLLARSAQSVAERHNRRIRLETVKQDRKLKESLGFAGKE
jgi:preprotein translocase subunit SecA